VHPVPDPLPLRKSGRAENRTRELCIHKPQWYIEIGHDRFIQFIGQVKSYGTHAETRFHLSAKRKSLFKSAVGRQISRLLAAEVYASAVVMLDTPCSEVA